MMRVCIIGGGLVGSLLAALMGKNGYQVDVYERRQDMRSTAISAGKSINMACSTRGWKALDMVGVGDRVREAAIPMYGRTIHSKIGELTFQPYGKENEAIYSISRGGLNMILINFAEAFENVNFHFNQRCIGVNLDLPTATFENTSTGKQMEVSPDLIFGTDGAFSAVRAAMQKLPHFDYSQEYISHDYKELSIDADHGEFRMDKNSLHIWPRGSYMLIALPNPDGSFTCTLFLPYEGENSFDQLETANKIQSFFHQTFPDALEMMPNLVEQFEENHPSSLVLIKCFPWTSGGKVAILGDASHAIVPFYGQGMNAGFEDVSVLNDLMHELGDDWETIFKKFEKSRKPNADAIADLAMKNFVEMRDFVGQKDFLTRKKLERIIHEKYPGKFTPQYSMISFSDIPYEKAVKIGDEQADVLDQLMAFEHIADLLENGNIHLILEKNTYLNS